MSYKTKKLIIFMVVVLALVIPTVALSQTSWRDFDQDVRVRGRLIVDGVATFIASPNMLDDLTVGDNLTVADDVNVGDWLVQTTATTVTVTSGGTLTPAGTFQPISAAGTVGFGAINGCDGSSTGAGRILRVENGANQTITITETGNLKMAGNFAMGQYDTITYVCAGSLWIEFARVNN